MRCGDGGLGKVIFDVGFLILDWGPYFAQSRHAR